MNGQPRANRVVLKVGGSLYDFPSLGHHLNRFLDSRPSSQIAIFPGGGPGADMVRRLEICHGLGEERSHWLAVRSLTFAAHFLAELLDPRSSVVSTLRECQAIWAGDRIGIIDPEPFARADARRKDALPRTWAVTSDSLALQLARRWQASRLILLKSVDAPLGWPAVRAADIVDPWFERLLAECDGQIEVSIVNLRQWMGS